MGGSARAGRAVETVETWWLRTLVARVESLRSELAESIRESRRVMMESARLRESARRPRVREMHTMVGDGDPSAWPENLNRYPHLVSSLSTLFQIQASEVRLFETAARD